MCISSPKAPKIPPPAPIPQPPPLPDPDLKATAAVRTDKDRRRKRKQGTRALRNDLQIPSGTSGISIPGSNS